MSLKFGTDGVRGPADQLPDEFVHALGRAAARVLGTASPVAGGGQFVIGRDTRESGARIERALQSGVEAEGFVVELVGVVPTPTVASRSRREDVAGAMISASHNPYVDNGIKFFAPGGRKLSDEVEQHLEAELEVIRGIVGSSNDASARIEPVATPSDGLVGDEAVAPVGGTALGDYAAEVVSSIEGRRLDGLTVVIDCANGAASVIAPTVLRSLGARVSVIHATPNGRNINASCGSTHPESLQAAVVAAGAQVGLAFDGDADRVLAVDETGALVDGDQLIALCATDMRERGTLAHDTVVVTVMTNLGFRVAMADQGISVVETQVGDRYVLEALEAGGYSLGGEQSGHVIFRRLATTGDGLLSGVQLLDLLGRAGQPLSALAARSMRVSPQVLTSIRVAHRDPAIADSIANDIALVEAELGATGRVLVRPSGTEPVVRVMVEAPTAATAQDAADRLVAAVLVACGPA